MIPPSLGTHQRVEFAARTQSPAAALDPTLRLTPLKLAMEAINGMFDHGVSFEVSVGAT